MEDNRLTPVRCGCGGEPKHEMSTSTYRGRNDERHYISCDKCLIMASGKSREEAVEKWNTALSGNRMKIYKVILGDNPMTVSAKPYKVKKRWYCGACSTSIGRFWTYCQKCGTEIDWSGNE